LERAISTVLPEATVNPYILEQVTEIVWVSSSPEEVLTAGTVAVMVWLLPPYATPVKVDVTTFDDSVGADNERYELPPGVMDKREKGREVREPNMLSSKVSVADMLASFAISTRLLFVVRTIPEMALT
jgi:hypothetical protein